MTYIVSLVFPGAASVKGPACQYRRCKRCRFDPWVGKIPWRRERLPTPVFSPGDSHGQRSLVGYIVHRVAKSWTRLKQLSVHPSAVWRVFQEMIENMVSTLIKEARWC